MKEDKSYNSIALITLVFAKLFGLIGIIFMFSTHYVPAILFLTIDGLLLVATFILCLKSAKKQYLNLRNKCPSIITKGYANCNGCKDYNKCWSEEEK